MLRTRRKVYDRENIDNEILTETVTLKKRRIEACKKKIEENKAQLIEGKQRIATLIYLLKKYNCLQQESATFFFHYTALLKKTLTDIDNLKGLQMNRETLMLKQVKEFEKDLNSQNKRIHESQETENMVDTSSNNGLPDVLRGDGEEETLSALIAANDKKYADLQMRLEGNLINNTRQVDDGKKLYKFFSSFRHDLKQLKAKLIEYATLVEEERQRLCLVKCLRMDREAGMMEELHIAKEELKRREVIEGELQELLTELKSKKCRNQDNLFLHKLSLIQ